jgi:hypothetical protein
MVIARLVGMSWTESFLAATALTGCSVSMTYLAWTHFKAPTPQNKQHLLLWMVSVEIVAIVILTAGNVVLKKGFGWVFLIHLIVIAVTVIAIGAYANRLTQFLGVRMRGGTRWRVHYIVLFVLVIAAIGDRLGLAAAKTAFFLGLFISRASHEGITLGQHLRPISQHLLIPIFFISLGAYVPLHMFATEIALYALGTVAVLLIVRDLLHRTLVQSGCARSAFLLVCPNLTIVAIGANTLREGGIASEPLSWLILTSVFLSVIALLAVPSKDATADQSAANPPPQRPQEEGLPEQAGSSPPAST